MNANEVKRIVALDCCPTYLNLLTDTFQCKYSTYVFTRAEWALAHLRHWGADLLIMNLRRTDICSFKLAEEARSLVTDIPIILATGYDIYPEPWRDERLEYILAMPHTDFFNKPFIMRNLAARVDELMGEAIGK